VVPTVEEEALRDLVRAREDLRGDRACVTSTCSVSRRTRNRVPPGANRASANSVSVDIAVPQGSAPTPPALKAR
jgi:hypothetical protein